VSRPPKGHIQRRDPDEAAIVTALEGLGAVVKRMKTRGMPDLWVGFDGRITCLEVKRPAGKRGGKSESGQHLNADQRKFFDLCYGQRLPVFVVTTVEEAIAAVKAKSVRSVVR
jgi:hypothetical protein